MIKVQCSKLVFISIFPHNEYWPRVSLRREPSSISPHSHSLEAMTWNDQPIVSLSSPFPLGPTGSYWVLCLKVNCMHVVPTSEEEETVETTLQNLSTQLVRVPIWGRFPKTLLQVKKKKKYVVLYCEVLFGSVLCVCPLMPWRIAEG